MNSAAPENFDALVADLDAPEGVRRALVAMYRPLLENRAKFGPDKFSVTDMVAAYGLLVTWHAEAIDSMAPGGPSFTEESIGRMAEMAEQALENLFAHACLPVEALLLLGCMMVALFDRIEVVQGGE